MPASEVSVPAGIPFKPDTGIDHGSLGIAVVVALLVLAVIAAVLVKLRSDARFARLLGGSSEHAGVRVISRIRLSPHTLAIVLEQGGRRSTVFESTRHITVSIDRLDHEEAH